jgi:hypothetical protein
VEPETSAAGDTPAADTKVPGQKLYFANKESAARTAEVKQEEGQSLGALAATLTPGGGQQVDACGLANLAMTCVEEGAGAARFEVPIPWNWFCNEEQQERWGSIFLQDAYHIHWNYSMAWMGQYYPPKLVVGEVRSTWFDHFADAVAWCLQNWDGNRAIKKNLSRVGGYLADCCLAELSHGSGKTVKAYIAIINSYYEVLFDTWLDYLRLRGLDVVVLEARLPPKNNDHPNKPTRAIG